jgi:SAM-dependent methyltransferase
MFSVTHFEDLAPPSHDELARQQFVSVLRKRIMADMARDMRQVYEREVEPRFVEQHGRAPRDGREIRKAMLDNAYFKAWSALRYSAQEMTWWSVMPQVERNLPAMVAAARQAAEQTEPARGSLRLNPELEIPRDVSALDIHLMPGCFHSEHGVDDVAQGAVYTLGTAVFGGALKLRSNRMGGVAASIAHWLRLRYPQFSPKALLDLGCTTGSNLFPYLAIFPGLVGHGVDVGAPVLRYAHARAQSQGLVAHFSQQNAESLDYADNSFDIVCSSFFLHEQSVASTRRILRESFRVLRPGGVMVHMELPPASEVDPYYNFYLDWDAFYNNEPHYAGFRALDFPAEVARAGFAASQYFQTRIPNWGTIPEAEFEACAQGQREAPAHGNGASWFIFGAWK